MSDLACILCNFRWNNKNEPDFLYADPVREYFVDDIPVVYGHTGSAIDVFEEPESTQEMVDKGGRRPEKSSQTNQAINLSYVAPFGSIPKPGGTSNDNSTRTPAGGQKSHDTKAGLDKESLKWVKQRIGTHRLAPMQ